MAPASPLEIDPRMVLEIAQGIEEPSQIAERYGLTPQQFKALAKHRPFRLAVLAKMGELRATGYTFKLRAGIMADKLLERLFQRASDEKTSTDTVLEAAKWMAKMGQLEPKEDKAAGVGTGFSVTINLQQPAEVKVSPDGATAQIGGST